MNLVRSSFFVTSLSISVTLISFLNQVILASFFGTSNQMDLFLIGTSFPFMIAAILSSSFSYYLIPEFVRSFTNKNFSEQNFLGIFILNINKKILLIIIPLALIFYLIIPHIYMNKDSQSLNLLRTINFLSWINIFISINYSIFLCYLNSKKLFFKPIILNSIPFIFSIFFVLIFNSSLQILSVIIGTIIGNILILIIIGYKLFRKFDYKFNNEISLSIKKIFPLLILTMIAMLSFSAFQSIDSFLVPRLGESVMSNTGYAQRLVIAIGSLVITGPSVVLVPRLTESFNKSRYEQYFSDSFLVNKLVILFSSIIGFILILNSKSVVKILFERGEFDSSSTIGVSSMLSYYLFGMIFMLISVVNFRILFTKKVNIRLSIIGITTASLYFIFLSIFSSFYGQDGIGYAYILTWFLISLITLYEVFKSQILNFLNIQLLFFLLKNSVIIFVIFISNELIDSIIEFFFIGFSNIIVNTFIKISIQAIISFIMMFYILKMEEFKFIVKKIFNK